MQQPVGLGVALHRHRAHDPVRGGLHDLHAHTGAQVSGGEQGRQVDAERRVLVDDLLRELHMLLLAHGALLRSS
ncbi:hypothetical protein SAURM35S_06843 [Streptomyces aurantiogriseus]